MHTLLRDVRDWLYAVVRHWIWLAGGAVATLTQWLWHPTAQALRPVAVGCAVVAVFLAWRDERKKVQQASLGTRDPELDLMRPQFAIELGKLSATEHRPILQYVVRCGGRETAQVQQFLKEQGRELAMHEVDRRLREIVEHSGFLTGDDSKGSINNELYTITPAWKRLLVEWAAPAVGST